VRELITNAARACRARSDATDTWIRLTIDARAGRAVISVEDNGVGMSPDLAKAVFQPFFSTRPEGRGLGLFLARAHLQQLGGSIALESEPGRGTKMSVVLPLLPSKELS
jgi:signal transduction histidine kinase